ncbi:beta-ketoacyl-[acyl-carrier-protein] synthase family protein [Ottowia thiooxydans]|uniref:beta-ketoacyl-[acyl-carrier-protein] synthase family protein n=1 Tax=Ottowia thiooxydans TaxID=219182 RepID=UPI0003F88232|nr:beta-ketoacyl-[acyl-carrier-protein] synthase family protein [Ottowia thiooxydans]
MHYRVAVTGLGIVNPFDGEGEPNSGGVTDFFQRITNGQSAVSLYETQDIPRPISVPAVRCAAFRPELRLGKALSTMMERFAQLGVAAAFDAWQDAGLDKEYCQASGMTEASGVAWGTALGGLMAFERGYRDFWQHGRERVPPMSVVLGMNNAAAGHISIQLGLGNSALTYSVACASAATAIGEAFQHIRNGRAKLMVAGGSDATLAYAVVRAWEALKVLSPGDKATAPQACRPFHPERAGLVLGEGAAALVLEDWDHAVARNARIYAEIAGYGANADHMHLVRPDQNGQVAAMNMALNEAGLSPSELGYVNAHGTATREGDPIEIAALRTVFGRHAEQLAVSATKSAHGHLMGATGAVEALLTVLALHYDTLPPTAHLDRVDASCAGVAHVRGTALRGSKVTSALSNSFAFGGSNAVLAFKAVR